MLVAALLVITDVNSTSQGLNIIYHERLFNNHEITPFIMYHRQPIVPDCCYKRTVNQLAKIAVCEQALMQWKLCTKMFELQTSFPTDKCQIK